MVMTVSLLAVMAGLVAAIARLLLMTPAINDRGYAPAQEPRMPGMLSSGMTQDGAATRCLHQYR